MASGKKKGGYDKKVRTVNKGQPAKKKISTVHAMVEALIKDDTETAITMLSKRCQEIARRQIMGEMSEYDEEDVIMVDGDGEDDMGDEDELDLEDEDEDEDGCGDMGGRSRRGSERSEYDDEDDLDLDDEDGEYDEEGMDDEYDERM